MHIKRFGILRYDERREVFSTQYNVNFNIGRRVDFEKNDTIHKFFMEKNAPFIVSEALAAQVDPNIKETLDLLREMKVEILLPLNIKNRVVGLIALGAKESGDLYNSEDLQVLGIVASQSAIAIENAMLYEETLNFNTKLEKEVELATRDLRSANERLKKLDQAKSEFISIASHQLRTPLTIIKGYISMMLEGSFGKIGPVSRDALNKVYDSNERLVYLVENLLNISRIESGSLKFNYETMHLEKVVESVVEELREAAKAKNIQIEYDPPKKDLPLVKVDAEKIRQVLMNLIDNAIKYTSRGKVKVVFRKKGDNLFFSVTDKGMGISSEDIPHLFRKFIRGQGAMLAHTEGTGLGLYVAKQMIDAHHGRIWVESQGAGKGSKFCFELPIGGTADE
jgi:signal transduction histidine kinase